MGAVIPSGGPADEEVMFIKKPTSANPTLTNISRSHRPWIWEQISSVVPELPCGAITLILLLGRDPQQQHERTVEDLAASLLEQSMPLTYVAVDYAPGHLGENLGRRLDGVSDDLAGTVIDTDYTVMARTGNGVGHVYGCGLPSLDVVGIGLAQAGDADQRLVILDGFQRARPYRSEGGSVIPAHVSLTSDEVDAWRSADLREFALSRSLVVKTSPSPHSSACLSAARRGWNAGTRTRCSPDFFLVRLGRHARDVLDSERNVHAGDKVLCAR